MAVVNGKRAGSRRAIGMWGTMARLLAGALLAGTVVVGSFTGNGAVQPASWLVGLVVFPGLFIAGLAWRARLRPARLVAVTGVAGKVLIFGGFLALYATPWYAPQIDFLSDAALLFVGSSLLLSAYRGYAGCEVLAIPNWLLRRDDQVGCLMFDPVDRLEGRRAS